MRTQTVWGNKKQSLVQVNTRTAAATVARPASPALQHASFYLTFILFALPLYGLLRAALHDVGAVWRWEYALWAAVPASGLTVVARHLARRHLRRS